MDMKVWMRGWCDQDDGAGWGARWGGMRRLGMLGGGPRAANRAQRLRRRYRRGCCAIAAADWLGAERARVG